MSSKTRLTVLIALSLALALPPVAHAQDHPNLRRGAFGDSAGRDNVNLFNGNLSFSIPLGQTYPVAEELSYGFRLVYNSNAVWEYRAENGQSFAEPSQTSSAGLGWTFSLPRILPRQSNVNPSQDWILQAGDGGQHTFFSTLHHDGGGDSPIPIVRPWAGYTRDGSYLRIRRDATAPDEIWVDRPDGSALHFDPEYGHLEEMRGPTGFDQSPNLLTVTYDASAQTYDLSDSTGRSHHKALVGVPAGCDDLPATYDLDGIQPGTAQSFRRGYLKRLTLAKFGGGSAVYDLEYSRRTVQVEVGMANQGATFEVCMLAKVHLPDGSVYELDYASDEGRLVEVELPSNGRYEYDYGNWYLDSELDPRAFSQTGGGPTADFVYARGVTERRTYDAGPGTQAPDGVWSYQRPAIEGYSGGGESRLETIVTSPERVPGDASSRFDTVYYFSRGSIPGPGADPDPDWSYGLPFRWGDPSSPAAHPPYLSMERFDGTRSSGNVVLRRYARFEADVTMGARSGFQANQRSYWSRTEYPQDVVGGEIAWTEVQRSDFDGLGHYRQQRHRDDFDSLTDAGAPLAERTTTLVVNAGSSLDCSSNPGDACTGMVHLPGDGAPPPDPPDLLEPWLLSLVEESRVVENGQTAKTLFCLDDVSGALLGTRRVANLVTGSISSDDVVRIIERDANGNPQRIYTYGADSGNPPNQLCTPTGTPAYREQVAWTHGTPSSHAFLKSNGSVFLQTMNATIDRNTGLIASVRNSGGVETLFDYDSMARLERIVPAEGATVTYTYDIPQQNQATATPSVTLAETAGSQSENRSKVVLDGLGRVRRNAIFLENGISESSVRSRYNGLGWRIRESIRTTDPTPDHWTDFSDYDVFGRVGKVFRPDAGASPNAEYRYTGFRKVENVARYLGAGGVAASHSTFLWRDGLGRLKALQEASLNNGDGTHSTARTSYGYDVLGHLVRTETQNGAATGGPQVRTATFDGLGFLRGERHPELGRSGDGTITYRDYDPLGNLLFRRVDSPEPGSLRLRYRYDSAGRPTQVHEMRDSPLPDRLMQELFYDSATGWLVRAERHNYLDLAAPDRVTDTPFVLDPPPVGGPREVIVSDELVYDGAGRLSTRTTRANRRIGEEGLVAYRQSYHYDDFGRLDRLDYPECLAGCPGSVAPPRTAVAAFEHGWLNQVSAGGSSWDVVTDIDYHDTGMVYTREHGNDTTETVEQDSTGIARPSGFAFSGIGWSRARQSMTYDLRGDLTSMSVDGTPESYRYDPVGRLRERAVSGTIEQSWDYDRFGNMTAKTLPGGNQIAVAVDGASNRLTTAIYDDSGQLIRDTNQGWRVQYDALGMPSAFASSGASPETLREFVYDAFGERIAVRRHGDDVETWTARDGTTVRRVLEQRGDDWFWIQDYHYAGGLAATERPEGVQHFHLDHLGSPILISDDGGHLVRERRFYPFGETAQPADDERLGFTGHERDGNSEGNTTDDLDYMHARYYSPHYSRFLSPDPVRGNPADPQSLNLYAYVQNNPLTLVDPLGLDKVDILNADDPMAACEADPGCGTVQVDEDGPEDGVVTVSEEGDGSMTLNEALLRFGGGEYGDGHAPGGGNQNDTGWHLIRPCYGGGSSSDRSEAMPSGANGFWEPDSPPLAAAYFTLGTGAATGVTAAAAHFANEGATQFAPFARGVINRGLNNPGASRAELGVVQRLVGTRTALSTEALVLRGIATTAARASLWGQIALAAGEIYLARKHARLDAEIYDLVTDQSIVDARDRYLREQESRRTAPCY